MPEYFYAFYPKADPHRTICVDTSITGGIATAEPINGMPKDQITMRSTERNSSAWPKR